MDEELSRMSDDPADHLHPIRTLSAQPLEALKKDHQIVKLLFERYLNTSDAAVKSEAGPRILMLLEMHADLEETTLYPKARSVDANLVDHSQSEHDEMRQMIQELRSMQPDDPQCDKLYQKLCDTVMDHVEEEENELFPKIRQSNIDLEALGLEMQAYEASMVASHAKNSAHKST